MADSQLTVRALWQVNNERSAFGLRTNDYERYRKHCANKVHRLRCSLKMTHGKGREFKKLPAITAQTVKDGHLQLLLFEAERAWAYGQELMKQSVDSDDNTLRRKAIARFRRAISWTEQLTALTTELFGQSRVTALTQTEALAYSLVLHGKVLRQRDDFEPALANFAVAKTLLDSLAANATTSRDQALASAIIDEISPEIRYCAHELGRSKAYDIDGVVAEQAPKHRETLVPAYSTLVDALGAQAKAAGTATAARKTLKPVTWEGTPVPIRNPELVDVFIRIQEAEAKLDDDIAKEKGKSANSRGKVAKFDAVLLALSDAEDVSRKLLEAQQLTGTSQASAPGTRDIHFIHSFIVYRLLSRRIQRDLSLVSALLATISTGNKAPSSADEARLYPAVLKLLDTALQSLTQQRALSIIDESAHLASAIEARLSAVRARRCIYLARCYTPLRRYAEALALAQRAGLHLRETRTLLADAGADAPSDTAAIEFFPLDEARVDALAAELTSDETRHKREWFVFNGGKTSTNAPVGNEHKPLFFDIALNYVQLPMDKLLERAGKPPEPKTAAISVAAAKTVAPSAKPAAVQKARVEEPVVEESPTSELAPQAARGGLSSLLGGWWGRK
ncbi:hypothetical protein BKA62DRAFT_694378 [Auriculariales sp. MPI-PUGE-AT-0066]|nr:hypothetical protein BKA62DRAFT_694378 [Auriculariales sp. MPI-PUGE-AT-0066]